MYAPKRLSVLFAVAVSSLLMVADQTEATVRRVKSGCSSSCDGSDWTHAYPKLRDAIAASSNGDEIWVAAGTYYPDECTSGCTANSRSETFNISNPGVFLFGGFAGTETSRSQRSYGCAGGANAEKLCSSDSDCPSSTCNNPTTLSGDIQQDGVDSHKSYHVVTYSTANAYGKLDGFTVKSGYANGSAPDNQGGAIQLRSTSQVCISGSPVIQNCVIENNYATDHGAVNDHTTSAYIDNCLFRNNTAGNGAALKTERGSASITNCTFDGNTATNYPSADTTANQGGAIWFGRKIDASCTGSSTPVVDSCTFTNNTAVQGGAIWGQNSNVTIKNSTFKDNTATGEFCSDTLAQGGAVWLGRSSDNPQPTSLSQT